MKTVDRLVEFTKAYTAAGVALYEIDTNIVSGVSEALHAHYPECHVTGGLIDVLAKEAGADVRQYENRREFEYGGVLFFEREKVDDEDE